MKVIYTKHAEEKLKRLDFRKFKISKKVLSKILKTSKIFAKTKYGERTVIGDLDKDHNLRIIYVKINKDIKIITFHITRKGRYEN